MERYDYFDVMMQDVREAIPYTVSLEDFRTDREGLEEELNDRLWISDSVTGNASGSYFCNAWRAEEAICHNWELLEETADAFGYENVGDVLKRGPETADVIIRCYLLPQVIREVLDEMEEDGFFQDEEETEE